MNDFILGTIVGGVGLPLAEKFVSGFRRGFTRARADQDPGADRRVTYPKVTADGTPVFGVKSVEFSLGDQPPAGWGPPITRDILIPIENAHVNQEALAYIVRTSQQTAGNARDHQAAKVAVFSDVPSFDSLITASTGPAVYKLVWNGEHLEFTNASSIEFEDIPEGTPVAWLGVVCGDRILYPQPLNRVVVSDGVTCSLAPGDFHFIQKEHRHAS